MMSKANAGLALIYIKRGKFELGKPLFDKVTKQDPDNNEMGLLPELYVNVGLHYGNSAAGDNEKRLFPDRRKRLSRRSLTPIPTARFMRMRNIILGITYAIQEKFELAIATLEKLTDARK